MTKFALVEIRVSFATFWDKGTEIHSLSRDKRDNGTSSKFCNGTGLAGTGWDNQSKPGMGQGFDVLPRERPGRDLFSLSHPVPQNPRTTMGQKGKNSNKI